MASGLEAVQLTEWGVWHAVRRGPDDISSDLTFCGRAVRGAVRMWETWEDKHHRCKVCLWAIASGYQHQPTTPEEGTQS